MFDLINRCGLVAATLLNIQITGEYLSFLVSGFVVDFCLHVVELAHTHTPLVNNYDKDIEIKIDI